MRAFLPFLLFPSLPLLLFRGKELRWPPNVIGAANPNSLTLSLTAGNPLKSTNGKAETANEN